MPSATVPLHNRIAIVFDFDETLAPDSYQALLESCGVDADSFKQQYVQPLVDDGWEEILAKCYCLIEESKRGGSCTITDEYLSRLGRDLPLYEGVPDLFERLREHACQHVPDIEVEFYVLSSGLEAIVRGTPIADQFKAIWGCQFHFDNNGQIAFVKRLVTHPEKTRYLMQISKGIAHGKVGQPNDVYRPVPVEDLHVPLNQIIYVGDGSSDMPAFGLMHDNQGIAIGVYKSHNADQWSNYDDIRATRRVENLAHADYSPDGELIKSLMLAIESICKRLALRKLGASE